MPRRSCIDITMSFIRAIAVCVVLFSSPSGGVHDGEDAPGQRPGEKFDDFIKRLEPDGGWRSEDFVVLSERPRVFYFPNYFGDAAEDTIARIQEVAAPQYTMALLDGAKANTNVRNSATHFMTCEEMQDPLLLVSKSFTAGGWGRCCNACAMHEF